MGMATAAAAKAAFFKWAPYITRFPFSIMLTLRRFFGQIRFGDRVDIFPSKMVLENEAS